MIPKVSSWANCVHEAVGYALEQDLSGHSCFRNYLYGVKRDNTDECVYCGGREDTDHMVFFCDRWEARRIELR